MSYRHHPSQPAPLAGQEAQPGDVVARDSSPCDHEGHGESPRNPDATADVGNGSEIQQLRACASSALELGRRSQFNQLHNPTMKKFPHSAATGQLGQNFVERVILQAGCKPVAYPVERDSGLDGHIEFVVNEAVTGKLIAFQVKQGQSFWRSGKPFVQTNKRELNYWFYHDLPVILVVVRPDGNTAYWMDVKGHIERNPAVIESGPYTLYPPLSQQFDSSSVMTQILQLAVRPDFGTVARNLSSPDAQQRLSGLETALAFRAERRACFVLVAALFFEHDSELTRYLCGVLSRYLPHPEASFSDISSDLRSYVSLLLTELPNHTLYQILSSFQTEDFDFMGPGVEEVYHRSDDEVWPPQEVFERGSIQQSMAVVAECIGKDRFGRIIEDIHLGSDIRCAAIALYAYCDERGLRTETVRQLLAEARDNSLRAWLYWLLFWMQEGELQG